MKNVIAHLTTNIRDIPYVKYTVFSGRVWRVRLWLDKYEQTLPFMAQEDPGYPAAPILIASLIVDFIQYRQVSSVQQVLESSATFFIDPADNSRMYVHSHNRVTFWKKLSYSSSIGVVTAFSHREAVPMGTLTARPFLLDFPDIEDTADPINYQRMAFSSGRVSIDNSKGQLDDYLALFGNDLTLLHYTGKGEAEVLRQFFVANYELSIDEAVLQIQDIRSRLSVKAPNAYFSQEQFPFLDERNIDKPMQDAYGRCRGVEGMCVNRDQIYTAFPVLNDWFRFRFARTITEIHEVWVQRDDLWVQVFPGLGVPGNDDAADGEEFIYQETNPIPIRIVPVAGDPVSVVINNKNLPRNNGVIEIWWSQCLRDNPGFIERRGGEPEKVKMTGVFVNKHNPADIISDIVFHYGNIPFDENSYNMNEWNSEKKRLADIGFCLTDSKDIFDWIERIQNASVLGFQLGTCRNLFTIRADDPEREKTFSLDQRDIQNRDEIALEVSGDNYASFATINFGMDYADGEHLVHVNDSFRQEVLAVYRFEKEYENDSYLQDLKDAKEKAELILGRSIRTRPVLRGLRIKGLHWDWLRLYAMGTLDVSIDIPSRMRKLIIANKPPRFDHVYDVQIIGIRRDLKEDASYIDLILEMETEEADIRIVKLISETGLDQVAVRGRMDEKIILMNKMQGE